MLFLTMKNIWLLLLILLFAGNVFVFTSKIGFHVFDVWFFEVKNISYTQSDWYFASSLPAGNLLVFRLQQKPGIFVWNGEPT